MTPDIQFVFHDGLDLCDITVSEGGKSASFQNLRVKRVNLRDWQDVQMVYQVFIPCAKALGRDYMLLADRYSIIGRQHPEARPIVFTPYVEDDEEKPKKGKKKNADQLSLF